MQRKLNGRMPIDLARQKVGVFINYYIDKNVKEMLDKCFGGIIVQNKPTKSEHLAAKAYQRGFSQDGQHVYVNILCVNRGRNLYRDVNEACYQNDAFEVKDKNGRYINRNSAEKGLACYDATITNIRNVIEQSYDKYLQGAGFIIPQNIEIQLKEFVTQQIFRQPNKLRNARQDFVDFLLCFNNNIDTLEAEGVMQKLLLPQADEVGRMTQSVQQTPFEKIVYDQIKTFNIRIEVSNEDSIISSDNPIVAFVEDNNCFQICINKIIFPITSKMVVVLSMDSIGVAQLSYDGVKEINDAIAQRAFLQIISYAPISDDDFNRYLQLNQDFKQTKNLQRYAEQDGNRPAMASLQQLSDMGYIKIVQNPTNSMRPEITILQKDKLLKRFVEYYIDMAMMMQPTISYRELITYPLIINDSIDKQQIFLNMVDEYGWDESLIEMKRHLSKYKDAIKTNSTQQKTKS